MTPVEFKDQNMVFRKPGHMTDEQCGSLPAKQHVVNLDGCRFNAIESVWQLSEEELYYICKSKRIRLQVIANGMPPVALMAEAPEEEVKPRVEEEPNVKRWPDSKTVVETRFLEEQNILEVLFANGNKYHYKKFPSILWNDLIKAASAGQFINKYVKVQFECETIN